MCKVITAPRWWPHSLEKWLWYNSHRVPILCTHPDCREGLNLPENNCFEDARSLKNLENQIKITHTEEIWDHWDQKICQAVMQMEDHIPEDANPEVLRLIENLLSCRSQTQKRLSHGKKYPFHHNSFTIATCFKLCRFPSKTTVRRQVSKNCKNTTQPASSSTTNMNLSLHSLSSKTASWQSCFFSDSTSLEVLKFWRADSF